MALFFNLNLLEKESCNDSTKFLSMLYFHWNKAAPLRKSNISLRSKVPLTGHSFLLNPHDFFKDLNTDPLFRVQYIQLAGRRDYNLYKQYKVTYLDTSFFPDLITANIKANPLLEITPKQIKFKYER